MNESQIIDNATEEFENTTRRRALLPWWIKVFCWFFMLIGLMAFVCFFLGFTTIKPALAFYGFESYEPFSINGLIVITVGVFKGITAFLLWFEKDYAITFGKIDALIGIVICGISMLILPFVNDGINIQIRLELALLIPYLWKLNKIAPEWKNRTNFKISKVKGII
ncbi:hypothetical protein [Winogradskyella arenosi]|uniref:Uncharacterized protein n=1 Tax=Winogradskyella arenosi TaxID=533325 RepID=A0A368ZH36_9FLAO|nr:hypothetical protein [Winogradskyella arenosi]RCW91334.1 hypothetical protein DFQ08_103162 [Winogradskyella arenosi]